MAAAGCKKQCGDTRFPAEKASSKQLEWLAQKRGGSGRGGRGLVRALSRKEHDDLLMQLQPSTPGPDKSSGTYLARSFKDIADAQGADGLEIFTQVSPMHAHLDRGELSLIADALRTADRRAFVDAKLLLNSSLLDDALYSAAPEKTFEKHVKRLTPQLTHPEIPKEASRFLWGAAYALDTEVQLIVVNESGRVIALPPFAPNSSGADRERRPRDQWRLSDFGIHRLYILRYFHLETRQTVAYEALGPILAKEVVYEALGPIPGSLCVCSPPLSRDFAYTQTKKAKAKAFSSSASSRKTQTSTGGAGAAPQQPVETSVASDFPPKDPDGDCTKKCGVPRIAFNKASKENLEWLSQKRRPSTGKGSAQGPVVAAPGSPDKFRQVYPMLLESDAASSARHAPALSDFADEKGVAALGRHFVRISLKDLQLHLNRDPRQLLFEAVEAADRWAFLEAGYNLEMENGAFYGPAVQSALTQHVKHLPPRSMHMHREISKHKDGNLLFWAAAHALDTEVQVIAVNESGRVAALPPFAPNITTRRPSERSLSDFGIGRLYVLYYVHPATKSAIYEALIPNTPAGYTCACSPALPRDFAYRSPLAPVSEPSLQASTASPSSETASKPRAGTSASGEPRPTQAPVPRKPDPDTGVEDGGGDATKTGPQGDDHEPSAAAHVLPIAFTAVIAVVGLVGFFVPERRQLRTELAAARAAAAAAEQRAAAADQRAASAEQRATDANQRAAAAEQGATAAKQRATASNERAAAAEQRAAGADAEARRAVENARAAERDARRELAEARAKAESLGAELRDERRAAEQQRGQLDEARREGRGAVERAAAAERAAAEAEQRAAGAEAAAAAAAAELRAAAAVDPERRPREKLEGGQGRAELQALLERLWPAIVAGARQRECALCLSVVPEEDLRALLPCLHAQTCKGCVAQLEARGRQCPQCRKPFTCAERVFAANFAPAHAPAF
eukprot:tig00020563_g11200.t1